MSLQLFMGFLAGGLASLSPCVLPILPFFVGGVLQESKYAPLAMGLGMTSAFATIGLVLSSAGPTLGISENMIRNFSAIILIAFGFILLSRSLQNRFSIWTAPLSLRANNMAQKTSHKGLLGHFLTGSLLGAIWSPCSGPTLGVAFGMAALDSQQFNAFLVFLAFGVGASIPLLAVAYGSKTWLRKKTDTLSKYILTGKTVFGALSILVGILVLTSLDKKIESLLIQFIPDLWINFVSRF